MATVAASRSRRATVRRYLTPQHGVWPMLLLPFAAGVVAAGPAWWQLPLLVAWLSGYLLSYHALISVKVQRLERVRGQLALYGALTVPLAVVLVVRFPSLLWFAPAYAALLAVNAWYAWRRQERALLNDFASVAMCVLVAPMAAVVAEEPASRAYPAALVTLLYLAGTVPYVKTMIRERGERSYYLASVAYHVVALVVAVFVALPLLAVFGWFLLRAAWLPRLHLVPRRVGTVEILGCVLVLLAVALWVPHGTGL